MITMQDHRGSLWPVADAMVPYAFRTPFKRTLSYQED